MQNKIIVGYWNARGRAEIARMLLQYTQQQWTDHLYALGDREGLNEHLNTLNMDFKNIVYLKDGNFVFTQSAAVQRYIIERSSKSQGLLGKNIQERALVNNINGVLADVRQPMLQALYFPGVPFKIMQEKTLKRVEGKFPLIEKFVGDKSLLFDQPTWADFTIAQLSFYIQKMFPQSYKQYSFWGKIRSSIYSLPQIKKYYSDEKVLSRPFLYMPPSDQSVRKQWSEWSASKQ